jgi:hypothetical protein
MGYILIMYTHRVHACEHAREHYLNCGRIFFKFAMNILHMTTSCMGYILMFTHHERLSVRLSLDGFSSNLLGTYYKSPQVACATYAYMRARALVLAC